MTFVRQHIVLIMVVLTAIASACITDFLASPWAQQHAGDNLEGIGWIVGPFVPVTNTLGDVTTFFVLWLIGLVCALPLLLAASPNPQVASIQD